MVRMAENELENMAEDPLIIDMLAMAVADSNLSRNVRSIKTIPDWRRRSILTEQSHSTIKNSSSRG